MWLSRGSYGVYVAVMGLCPALFRENRLASFWVAQIGDRSVTWRRDRVRGILDYYREWRIIYCQLRARRALIRCSKMLCWKPEGRYRCTMFMAIAPFWFSTEHHYTALTPFWLSTDDIFYVTSMMYMQRKCSINYQGRYRVPTIAYHEKLNATKLFGQWAWIYGKGFLYIRGWNIIVVY